MSLNHKTVSVQDEALIFNTQVDKAARNYPVAFRTNERIKSGTHLFDKHCYQEPSLIIGVSVTSFLLVLTNFLDQLITDLPELAINQVRWPRILHLDCSTQAVAVIKAINKWLQESDSLNECIDNMLKDSKVEKGRLILASMKLIVDEDCEQRFLLYKEWFQDNFLGSYCVDLRNKTAANEIQRFIDINAIKSTQNYLYVSNIHEVLLGNGRALFFNTLSKFNHMQLLAASRHNQKQKRYINPITLDALRQRYVPTDN